MTDINIFGRLFTINIGRVTVSFNAPEITIDKAGITILAITWVGHIESPIYNYKYYSFCILGFGIGVQVRKKEESHA